MNNILQGVFCFLYDPLSLFFLLIVIIVAIPSAIYSVGYLNRQYSRKKIAYNWILFTGFIISMMLVVTAGNALFFLIAWELMSLISYFLVIFDHQNDRSISAGTIYVIMTHIGTAFITTAILILYKYAGSFDFTILRATAGTLPAQVKNLLFLFFFIGFGTKAGVVPFHLWLPIAHPQAPSHISSLMSAVMIKTAVYGLLRYVLTILGVDSLWWGNVIMIFAGISALVGIIYALMENDIKKLLAYSSVENMGIILFGLGLSFVFLKLNLHKLAVFALSVSLFHLMNHALFKGLLFLAAGSVYQATGTRNMEKLGGLIKKIPYTAIFFLLGAMAISALPPLNGFVSEWLTFQAFFMGALSGTGGMRVFLCVCAAVLALTGGLTAACFVKAFGITFLAMPRSASAENAQETGLTMKIGMGVLSALCIILGLGAAIFLKLLASVSKSILATNVSVDFNASNFFVSANSRSAMCISPLAIVIAFLLCGVFTYAILRFLKGKNNIDRVSTWDCGYYVLTSRNEYSAMAFSKPFRIAFSFFLLPYRKTQKLRDSFYHVTTFTYQAFTTPVFRKYLYEPCLRMILSWARFMRKIQPGSIHLYISYIFITIVILIALIKIL